MSDMNLTLKVWRQKNANTKGKFESYKVVANEHMSFLEMLDVLNEEIISQKANQLHLSMIVEKEFVVLVIW